jgi:hypothetical protein
MEWGDEDRARRVARSKDRFLAFVDKVERDARRKAVALQLLLFAAAAVPWVIGAATIIGWLIEVIPKTLR